MSTQHDENMDLRKFAQDIGEAMRKVTQEKIVPAINEAFGPGTNCTVIAWPGPDYADLAEGRDNVHAAILAGRGSREETIKCLRYMADRLENEKPTAEGVLQ